MRESSSNGQMEDRLDILKSIERVEVPDDLMDKIVKRINDNKLRPISKASLLAAAAAVLIFLSVDFYAISQNNDNVEVNHSAGFFDSNHIYHD